MSSTPTPPHDDLPHDAAPATAEDGVAEESSLRPDEEWRRLSGRMLLVHPVKTVGEFIPALIGLVLAGRASDGPLQWVLPLVGLVVALGSGIVRWFTTRYRFTDEQVQLRHGLLSRKNITTPADRVRTVDLTASPLHRALGLATVTIGTGADTSELRLDGLTTPDAAALRQQLLHRRRGVADHEVATGPLRSFSAEDDEEELLRFNPRWLRLAPFGPTGMVAVLALLGIAGQAANALGWDPTKSEAVTSWERQAEQWGPLIVTAVLGGTGIVLVLLASLAGYAISYGGYRLTRHREGGTFQVTRGLLTARAVTMEMERVRGVQLVEPISQRIPRGARLNAITTGLSRLSAEGSQSSMLAPPAPRSLTRDLVGRVLDRPGLIETPLRRHGRAAVRRRWSRALMGAAVPAGVLLAWGLLVELPWLAALAVVPLLLAVPLTVDRCRSLGHAVVGEYLVTRSGSISRRTTAVQRSGVIGLTTRRSFFQRRAGVATVRAATAAGSEHYDVVDVTDEIADELAEALLPGQLPRV